MLGALDHLLVLAKSDDVEVQMETLACLCNLSLCGCIGDNPLSFLDACSMQNLVAFLCSADSTYRLFGAVAIGNIVSAVNLQDDVVNFGALSPLIAVSNVADLETQRCIAYALCNLAADPKRRRDIVREGGLQSIISMACSEDQSDQLVAIATLRGISAQADNRRQVWTSNAVEALTLGTRAPTLEVRIETACTYMALSINDENKLDIAENDQALEDLLELLQEESPMCLRQAMGCLANLSERHETHPFLRRHAVHTAVLIHFEHEDVALVRETARLISNLCAVHDNHPPVVGGGAIKYLQLGCRNIDALSTRFSTLGLVNLSTLESNHNDLLESEVYNELIELARGGTLETPSAEWVCLNSLGEGLGVMEDDQGKITEQEPVSPRSKGDYQFVKQYGYDKETRRYAVLCLGNLALSFASHPFLITPECIDALNQCLDSPDDETRFNASFALNKLSRLAIEMKAKDNERLGQNEFLQEVDGMIITTPKLANSSTEENKTAVYLQQEREHFSDNESLAILGKSGCIPRLVDVLRSGGPDAVAQAMGALRHLAMCIDNRTLMLKGFCLDAFGDIAMKTKDKECLREIAACTCLLSMTDGLKLPIVSSTLLDPLRALCSNDDVEIARQACGAIANVAESKRTHKTLSNSVMPVMISLMQSKHLSIHREASRCVANLLSSSPSHRLFIDGSGLPALFRLCSSLDVETQYNCALIFRKLSPVLSNHELIISRKGLGPLHTLTMTQDIDVNRQAVAALRDMASNLNFKAIMAEQGCLKRAIDLTRDPDLQIRTLAMGYVEAFECKQPELSGQS